MLDFPQIFDWALSHNLRVPPHNCLTILDSINDTPIVILGPALYRATALATAVPFDIHTSIATDPTAALNVPAGGFGIAVSWAGFSAGTTSWTGLTEDYDVSVETSGGNFSSAHDSFVSAQSGLTVTANSSLDTGSVGVFASWAATSSIVVPRMIHHMRMQGVA